MAKAKLNISGMSVEERAALLAALTTGNVETVEVAVSSAYVSRKEEPATDAPAKQKAEAWLHRIDLAHRNTENALLGADGVTRKARGAGGKRQSERDKLTNAVTNSIKSAVEYCYIPEDLVLNLTLSANMIADYVESELKKRLTLLEAVKGSLQRFLDNDCKGDFPSLLGISWNSIKPTLADVESGSPTSKETELEIAKNS